MLRGDMSLVGPRPLLMQYLPRYTPAQARRHDVRPGITGRAQVDGRNPLSWDEKFRLDVTYVDTRLVRPRCRHPAQIRARGDLTEGHIRRRMRYDDGVHGPGISREHPRPLHPPRAHEDSS